MDRNTFWSHTAPSYEKTDCNDDDQVSLIEQSTEVPHVVTSSTIIHYHITTADSDSEDPSIEVRFFQTASVEHKDQRERKLNWFNKNR